MSSRLVLVDLLSSTSLLSCPLSLRSCAASVPPSLLPLLQIADLYKKQQQIQNQGEKAAPEDYY